MSKIANDGLTQPSIGCFIAVPMWHHWASKGKHRCSAVWHSAETQTTRANYTVLTSAIQSAYRQDA